MHESNNIDSVFGYPCESFEISINNIESHDLSMKKTFEHFVDDNTLNAV